VEIGVVRVRRTMIVSFQPAVELCAYVDELERAASQA
jgi:hypothetical protein